MRLLGWALIQYDWWPRKKRKFCHRHRENAMWRWRQRSRRCFYKLRIITPKTPAKPQTLGEGPGRPPSQPQKDLPSDTFTPDIGPLVQWGDTFLYHQYVTLCYPALANEHRSSCLMESRARQWCGTWWNVWRKKGGMEGRKRWPETSLISNVIQPKLPNVT